METVSYVVVFPAIFAKKRIPQLLINIKTILKIRGQQYQSIKRDCDVILVQTNDPVFASSAIGLLFGVSRVAIARKINNNFDEVISKIASIGGNMLLRGERFLVRVDGITKGYIAKDAEIAATSKIIERKEHGAIPGTEEKFDKELYTYVTRKNAYVCIFSDGAMWGRPTEKTQQERYTICAIYDELSAISCFECMRQGYDVKIMIFYKKKTELRNLVRLFNRLIPRMLDVEVRLEFIHLKYDNKSKSYIKYVNAITQIVLDRYSKKGVHHRIALAIPHGIFPIHVTDAYLRYVFEYGMIPIVPLVGSGVSVYEIARELSLGQAGIKSLEKTIMSAAIVKNTESIIKPTQTQIINTQKITIRPGQNNVHEILDMLHTTTDSTNSAGYGWTEMPSGKKDDKQ